MTGMEMMLKSMGFDPDKIKQSLMQAQQQIEAQVKSVHDKLVVIDERLQRLELHFKTLPDAELNKILASKSQAEIAEELEQLYGRNSNGDHDNRSSD